MLTNLKPYPAYKDSGVEWLGKVPAHWEIRRLGSSVRGCVNGVWGSEPNGKDDLPCVRVADFDRSRLRVRLDKPTMRAISSSDRVGRLLEPGDLLLEKSGGGDLQPVGRVVLYDHPIVAISSNFIARMPVENGYDSIYLTYLHAALYSIELNIRSIKQTTGIQNLDVRTYLSELVAFPPLPEQTTIVRFLEWADRRIRRVMRARQRQIKLLEEYKQALIHQAVTGQIDVRTGQPYPAYKPSGVEWLGKVPAHWEVVPLKRVTLGRLKYGANAAAEFNNPSWPRYLRITDFKRNGELREDTFRSLPPDVAKEYLVRPGDILLARSGATVGKSFLVAASTGTACYAGYLILVRPNLARTRPEFLFAFLQSHAFSEWKSAAFIVATIENISAEKYGDLLVPIPTLEEQECIVEWLKQRFVKIGAAIAAARREIELLREYRERLIADVVTGKVDVREVAARLSEEPLEEAAELAALDEAETLAGDDGDEDNADFDAVDEEMEA